MKDILRLAGCIIPNNQGEVLLIHRNTPKRLQWEVPGGKIDEIVNGKIVRSGHSAEDTVRRELKEEVDVDIEIVSKLGARDFQEDQFTMHYTWYLGRIKSGQARIVETDKYDGLKYFSQTDLQNLRSQLSGNTINFLNAWLSGTIQLPG